MQKSCFWLNSCLLLLVIFISFPASLKAQSSQSYPLLPCDFYGGEELPGALTPGKIIIARDSDGVLIGQANVTESGRYGFLTCLGDISGTAEDEGAVEGDIITFYLNGAKLRQQAVWKSGEAIKVDLGVAAEGGAFNLHLLSMPGYSNYNNDQRYSGVAVSDMILDYLNPPNSDSQADLMDYSDLNRNLESEGSELERLLNVKDYSVYNFGSTTTIGRYADYNYINQFDPASQSDCLKQICHWIAYQVPGAPQDKQYVPVAIATSANPAQKSDSDYQHWMSLVGVRTNQDPFPSLSDYASFREKYDVVPSIQLYGVYLNDPGQSGLGFHTYMAAEVFIESYFRPIAQGLTGQGSYLAILEPPDPEANPITIKTSAKNSELEIILTTPQREVSFFVPGWASSSVKSYLAGLFQQLSSSSDFSGLLDDVYFSDALQDAEVSRIFKVEAKDGADYTIIPFDKKANNRLVTTAAIIVNNQTGQFQIAFGDHQAQTFYQPLTWPEGYQALRNQIGWKQSLLGRWLFYSQGSALYPGWKAVTSSDSRQKRVVITNSFEYIISPDKEVELISESPAVEINSLSTYRKGRDYMTVVFFTVDSQKEYNLAIESKHPRSKVYLYNNGDSWLAVLEGPARPHCRLKIVSQGSSGNISQGQVSYIYIPR